MPTFLGCQCACHASTFQTRLISEGDCCTGNPGNREDTQSTGQSTGHEEIGWQLRGVSRRGEGLTLKAVSHGTDYDGQGVVAAEGTVPRCPPRNKLIKEDVPQIVADVGSVHFASAPPEAVATADFSSFAQFGVEDEFHESVDVPKAVPQAKIGEMLQVHSQQPTETHEEAEHTKGQMNSMQPPTELDEDWMPDFEGRDPEEAANDSLLATSATSASFALASTLSQCVEAVANMGRAVRHPAAVAAKNSTDFGLGDLNVRSSGSVASLSRSRPKAWEYQPADSRVSRRCTPRTPFWSMPVGCVAGPRQPAPQTPFSCLAQPVLNEDPDLEVPENEIMTVPLRTKEQRVDWRDFLCEMVATKKANSLFLLYDVDAPAPLYARPPPSDPKRVYAVGGVSCPTPVEQCPSVSPNSEEQRATTDGAPPTTSETAQPLVTAVAPDSVASTAPASTTTDQVVVACEVAEEPKPLDEPVPAMPPPSSVHRDSNQEAVVAIPEPDASEQAEQVSSPPPMLPVV